MTYGNEQAEARRLHSILEEGEPMTPPERPEPVAALADAIEAESATSGGNSPRTRKREDFILARLRASGYVLVNADSLAEADWEFDYEGWKKIPGFPPDDPALEHKQKAAAILAALQDKAVSRG